MKVCFLLGGFSGGGIGRVVSLLANEMFANAENEIVLLRISDDHKKQIYPVDERIKTRIIFPDSLSMKKAILKGFVGKVRQFLKEEDIDILIACGTSYFPASVLACKGIKTKCVCWDHTGPRVSTDQAFQGISRSFGARYSDVNVLLTQKAKAYYDTTFDEPEKNIVIYNPVDPMAVSKRSEYAADSHKIITVGRLTYQKNMEMLVSVADVVLKEHPNWVWDIYGDGELKGKIQSQIDSCGLHDYVTLKGQVANIYDLYKEYSFMVLTSRYEGFPMTLLEASANGLPMVSYDIETGPSEIIKNGINGYLVANETKEDMIKAVSAMINDREKRIDMSYESAKTSNCFEIKEISKQWYALFAKLYLG